MKKKGDIELDPANPYLTKPYFAYYWKKEIPVNIVMHVCCIYAFLVFMVFCIPVHGILNYWSFDCANPSVLSLIFWFLIVLNRWKQMWHLYYNSRYTKLSEYI